MEIWKDIEGYPGYEVSNLGRVMSHKRGIPRIREGRLSSNGYQRLSLSRDQKPPVRKYSIHRLVAQAFIPNPENKPQVNHINGVRIDNRVENLEWNTPSEDALHAFRIGLRPTKLTPKEVREIRESKIPNNRVLAKKYKVSSHHVGLIRNGKSRIHD